MKSAAFMSGVPIPIRISEPFASLTKFQMEKLEHKILNIEIISAIVTPQELFLKKDLIIRFENSTTQI